MKVVVSGGGTGGHILPILAVADWLRQHQPDAEILYIGQASGMEAKIAASAGFEFAKVSAGKFRRYHNRAWWQNALDLHTLWLNVRDSWRIVHGTWQAWRILRDFAPDVIFIKGGYVGLPVGIAAGLRRLPYVLHESDSIPGLTNRWLARQATAIAVAWPTDGYKQQWPISKLHFTGLPIRADVLGADKTAAQKHFGLQSDLPTILVTGGSQGARRINDAVIAALPELTQFAQIIHMTGEKEIERVRFEVNRLVLSHAERYQPKAFLANDYGLAMAVADIVITRAGSALAEVAVLGKPAIVIPGAQLTGGHQVQNARLMGRAGAVRVISEQKLNTQLLVAEVRRLASSVEERAQLQAKLKPFAVSDGAERLGKLILASARKSPSALNADRGQHEA